MVWAPPWPWCPPCPQLEARWRWWRTRPPRCWSSGQSNGWSCLFTECKRQPCSSERMEHVSSLFSYLNSNLNMMWCIGSSVQRDFVLKLVLRLAPTRIWMSQAPNLVIAKTDTICWDATTTCLATSQRVSTHSVKVICRMKLVNTFKMEPVSIISYFNYLSSDIFIPSSYLFHAYSKSTSSLHASYSCLVELRYLPIYGTIWGSILRKFFF